MFSFNDEVKSMDILKKTKNIIKERNCYGKFIKCYDHHKLKKYCYNGKLKKVPKLLLNETSFYGTSCSDNKRQKEVKLNNSCCNGNKRELCNTTNNNKNKKKIKVNSFDYALSFNSDDGRSSVLYTNTSNNNKSKQRILITETTTTANNIATTTTTNTDIKNNSFYNKTSTSFTNITNSNSYNIKRPLSSSSFINIINFNTHYNNNNNNNNNNTNRSYLRFHNDLFQNPRYRHLCYDESAIYGDKHHLYTFIENKVHDIALNDNNYNTTTYLDRDLTANNLYFNIKLSSVVVSFYDVNDKHNCVFQYELPLTLLPVFYYKNIDYFKMLLIKMISFSENYSRIRVNESVICRHFQKVFNIHQTYTHYNNTNSNNITSSSNSNLCSLKKIKFKKLNTTHLSTHSYNKSFNSKLSIRTTKTSNDHAKQNEAKIIEIFPSINKNNNSNKRLIEKQNVFKLIWLTPYKNYSIDIQTPSLILSETSSNTSIHSYIDFEFLFYLFKNHFIEWDYYCLNYLFSYKQCRKTMENLLSKHHHKQPHTIHLTPQYNSYNYIYNNYTLQFISSSNGINRLIELKPPSFKLSFTKYSALSLITSQTTYIINFTLSQAIKLTKSIDIIPEHKLKDLLSKFISITYNYSISRYPNVKFNYIAFDSICETDWLELLKGIDMFSGQSIIDNNNNINNSNNSHNSGNKADKKEVCVLNKKEVEIEQPCLIIKTIDDNGNEIVEHNEKIFPLFRRIVKCENIHYWPVLCSCVLNGNKKMLNEKGSASPLRFSMLMRRKTFHVKSQMISPKRIKKK